MHEKVAIARDFKITERIRKKYDYSEDYPGCDSKRRGLPQRTRSQECRKKLEKAMTEDEEDKTTIEKHGKKAFTNPVEQDAQGRVLFRFEEERNEEVEQEAEEHLELAENQDEESDISDYVMNVEPHTQEARLQGPPGECHERDRDSADPGVEVPSKRRRLQ